MQKVIIFLEKYVQWLALGFGALYVLWIVYGYVVTPPVTVAMGGKSYTPAEIDPLIVVEQVDPLNREMNNNQPVTPPKIADVLKVFKDHLDVAPAMLTDLTASLSTPPGVSPKISGESASPVAGNIVADLPKPPPAKPGPFITGWTVAMIAPAGAAPAAPAPTGAQPGAAERKDVGYYEGHFLINTAELSAEWNKAFQGKSVPINQLYTDFVTVELFRQEKQANGDWGPPTIIKTLPVIEVKPYPDAKADPQTWFTYLTWIKSSQDLIVHWPFYPTASDVPAVTYPPADAPAAGPTVPGAVAPAAPAAPATAPAEPNAPQFAAPGNGDFNPGLLVQPTIDIQVNDATLEEGKTYRYAITYRLYNPLYGNNVQASAKVAATFDMKSVPEPAADTKQWTAAVTVEGRSHVYVTKIPPIGRTADFAVFNWKDGHWKKTAVEKKTAGDPVGADKTSMLVTVVDVRKDSARGSEPYVLLMDERGKITTHDVMKDAADPDMKKYDDLSGQTGTTTTTGTPTPTPTPPPVPGRTTPPTVTPKPTGPRPARTD